MKAVAENAKKWEDDSGKCVWSVDYERVNASSGLWISSAVSLHFTFHNLSLLTGQRSVETDAGPSFAKSPEDAVSPSAHHPFLTAWATLRKCLFHIKEERPGTVTLINALKTSHPRPVASPLHRAQWTGDKTCRADGVTNFIRQFKCIHGAPSVGGSGAWEASESHSRIQVLTLFSQERFKMNKCDGNSNNRGGAGRGNWKYDWWDEGEPRELREGGEWGNFLTWQKKRKETKLRRSSGKF